MYFMDKMDDLFELNKSNIYHYGSLTNINFHDYNYNFIILDYDLI